MKPLQTIIQVLLMLLLLPAGSYAQETNNRIHHAQKKKVNMETIQMNKEVIRKLYEECMNPKKMEMLSQLVSPDYSTPDGKKGVEAFQGAVAELLAAFPDVQWTIHEMVAEGEKVFVIWTWKATHKGRFNRFPASGKTVTVDGMSTFTLKGGKITGTAVYPDRLAFLQQMEVVPQDLSQLSNKKQFPDRVSFIDRFLVPPAAKKEFYERMRINRAFIRNLPSFIEDEAYEYTDADGNLVCVTVAQWENRQAVENAREAVQTEYKKQGFDPAATFKQWNIKLDRGVYTVVNE